MCYFQLLVHRVRLVNGPSPHTGRVEVYTNSTGGVDNGEWGTICDDYIYYWNFWEARVVCRQLGYPDAVDALFYSYYGEGTGPIWLDDVWCLGNEQDIFACSHSGIGNHNCLYGVDASVECLGVSAL